MSIHFLRTLQMSADMSFSGKGCNFRCNML